MRYSQVRQGNNSFSNSPIHQPYCKILICREPILVGFAGQPIHEFKNPMQDNVLYSLMGTTGN
jgi:hypothetical protein